MVRATFPRREAAFLIMHDYQREFIEYIAGIGALRFGFFTTKSGRQTPYFINMGTFDSGERLIKLSEFYRKAIEEHFATGFEILYGPAYKGIPLVAAVSIALAASGRHRRDFPIAFNRKEAKAHGEGGRIVGRRPEGHDRVLIVEDVTTAGTSVHETVELLAEEAPSAKVVGLMVSVDRQEKGPSGSSAFAELQETYGIKAAAIVTLDDIVGYLHNRDLNGTVYISDEMLERINAYREKYGA